MTVVSRQVLKNTLIGLLSKLPPEDYMWTNLLDSVATLLEANTLLVKTSLQDENGNEAIDIPAAASAVNHLDAINAATGASPQLNAKGDDTNVSLRLGAKGTGVVAAAAPATEKTTQTATTDTATITIAQLLTKVLDGTPTSGATYTLPTAALLVAGMGPDCKVGDSFEFIINNKAASALTITVAAGSGGTADGLLTIAQNVIRAYRIIVTNVTGSSEAYFVYGLGT